MTVGVSSYNLTILWQFPDSVDLRFKKGTTHHRFFCSNQSPKRNTDSVNGINTSPGWMIVLYFFTNGEHASPLSWTYIQKKQHFIYFHLSRE